MSPGAEDKDWANVLALMRAQERPELERLALGFGWITQRCLDDAHREVDRLRALQDRDAVLKAQIKLSVMEHCREIFQRCHTLATGRRAWEAAGDRRGETGGSA